jgi:hypothetical protein
MGRRRIDVADVKEILVRWDRGAGVSAIARTLEYSRPMVRKYIAAAQRHPVGAVTTDVAAFHAYLAQHVGTVRLSVFHQRLRDEHGLAASWGTFYRYVRRQWPERMQRAPDDAQLQSAPVLVPRARR